MTDGRRAGAAADGRRLETLRRLELPAADDAELRDALELLRELLDADAVALTVLHAATAELRGPDATVRVGRAATLADTALDHDQPILGPLPSDGHPWRQRDVPVTVAAAATVAAPDGTPIGALEVGWVVDGAVPGRWEPRLTRAAVHLGTLLERRAEAAEYRRFVELAPDAITVLDLEGNVELANPAMAALLGVDGTRLVGTAFVDLVAAEDAPRVTAALARVLISRQPTASVDAELCVAGRRVPVSISAGHLRGARRSLQLVVRDLSERLRAEAERARLSQQLARAHRLETVGQLAGGLAHDLNNLLAVLLSNVGLAEETVDGLAGDLPLQQGLTDLREDLDGLKQASERVDGLTRRLLQFARRDAGQVVDVDVGEVAETLAGLLASTLGSDRRLDVDVHEPVPVVAADPGRLEQVLTNLILNARDATEPDGTITVTVTGTDDGRDVQVTVADDGTGMPPETLERAFEPLFSTKSADRGSGLGLSTVQAYVEEAGGEVTLRSTPQVGTAVTVRLPAAGTSGSLAAEGPRLVLLEPTVRSRQVLQRLLTSAGYQPVATATLDEALGQLEAAPTRAVLVAPAGLDRPVGDVVAGIRDLAPAMPVIVLQGPADGLDAGDPAAALTHPFGSDRLLAAVAGLDDPDRNA